MFALKTITVLQYYQVSLCISVKYSQNRTFIAIKGNVDVFFVSQGCSRDFMRNTRDTLVLEGFRCGGVTVVLGYLVGRLERQVPAFGFLVRRLGGMHYVRCGFGRISEWRAFTAELDRVAFLCRHCIHF